MCLAMNATVRIGTIENLQTFIKAAKGVQHRIEEE